MFMMLHVFGELSAICDGSPCISACFKNKNSNNKPVALIPHTDIIFISNISHYYYVAVGYKCVCSFMTKFNFAVLVPTEKNTAKSLQIQKMLCRGFHSFVEGSNKMPSVIV